MVASPARLALLAALLLPLCGCGNSPQQPSDTVDDQAAESPNLRGDAETDDSPDFAELGDPDEDPGLTGSAASPPSLDAVTGRWAVDLSACSGDAVVISATSFERAERVCRMAGAIDGGGGSVTATLACPGTAEEDESELVKLTPSGDSLRLSFVGSDQPEQTLTRCP